MKGIILAKSMGKKGTICGPNMVLGGLALPKDKEKEAESSEGKTSNPKKHQEGEREKSPEWEKNPKTKKEAVDPPKEQNSEVEIKDTNPLETQNPETGTKTSDPPKEQDPLSTPGKAAK